MSRQSLVREQMKLFKSELERVGVTDWHIEPTRGNHYRLLFYRSGKSFVLTFAPCGEWRSVLNNRARIRRMIKDADRSGDQNEGQPVLRAG